jgi:hypothetical protein
MPDTMMPSTTEQPTGNLPASQTAAVSSAISQAIPPSPQGAKRSLPTGIQQSSKAATTSDSTGNSNNQPGDGDKVLSLDDFDGDAKEIDPKDEGQSNKPVKQDIKKSAKSETSETPESDPLEKEESEDESDNKLELDLNLEEDPTEKLKKSQEEKELGKIEGKRDYSKFKPEHAAYLKNLPNHLFKKASEEFLNTYKIELENKELKEKLQKQSSGQLPDSYYEHPQAFELTRQYQELKGQLEYDNFEERHWLSQLARVKKGQPWLNLIGYDEKTGQPQYQTINPPQVEEGQNPQNDIDAEIKIQNHISNLQLQKRERETQLAVFKNQHQQTYEKSKQGIKSLESRFFKAFEDESKLDKAVKADIQLAREALEKESPAFKDNPLTSLLIKSYAALKVQQRQLIKLASLMNQTKEAKQDALRAGPGKEDFQGGSAKGGDKILSESDFND